MFVLLQRVCKLLLGCLHISLKETKENGYEVSTAVNVTSQQENPLAGHVAVMLVS